MRRCRSIVIISLLIVCIVTSIVGCASTFPLPESINIVPPSQNLPAEIAAFSGCWKGKWSGYHEILLIVEKIDLNKATVIISYGLAQGFEPRYYRRTAIVTEEATIKMVFFNEDQMAFKMDNDLSKLHGTYIENKTGAKYKAELYKQDNFTVPTTEGT